jgi:hypothetical protein
MLLTELISDIFARTTGAVTVINEDGEKLTSTDLIEVGKFASACDDPWIDLVTDKLEAIGTTVMGKADALLNEPTVVLADGAAFLFDGDPVAGDKQGFHWLPLVDLQETIDKAGSIDDIPWCASNEFDLSTEASQREITLMTGRNRSEYQGKWKPVPSTFGQFAAVLCDHLPGKKDGPCFLQGEAAGGTRKAVAMISNEILGVDLDSGAPLEDVIDTIQKFGLDAVIYTTHSHMKDTSVIKRDHFMKKMDTSDADPELLRDYLIEWKGILPAIVEDLEVIDDAHHSEEGIVILVKHKPMPKFRAVFSLKEPFVFAKRGGTQKDAIAEWKERYAGFCTALGLFFDEKCVDPARLFYLPRHPKGNTSFGSWRIVGDPLDLDKFDRVKISRRRKNQRGAGPANAFTDASGGESASDDDDRDRYKFDGKNLLSWAKKHAHKFEVQTMLEECIGGDFIREDRGGKPGVHVECPFEAEHSSFGGMGTFVVNASDNIEEGYDSGFTFTCVHDACSGRDRLDFLRELLEQELITWDDLTNPEFMIELEEEEDDEQSDSAYGNQPARQKRHTQQTPQEREQEHDEQVADDDFGDDEVSMLKAFNRRYAVIRTAAGVRILVEPRTPDEHVRFETQNDVALFERQRVLFLEQKNKSGGTSVQKVQAFQRWLEWDERRTYRDVVFKPGVKTPKDVYNLFRGWPYEPQETTWQDPMENFDKPVEGDWSMLRGHLYENICEKNDEWFEWFMTWMAQLFQNPSSKPGSTVVITGDKGTGKSTLFDFLNQLLGRCGITVSQRKQIVGQFNGHLAECLLMVCEEAFWAADPQAEGVLKDMITNRSMLIERKGADPIQADNYTRLALISNSDWVVPASLKDERRFFVLRCGNQRRGDIHFWEDCRNQMMKKGGLEAMLYDLMHWEPSNGTFGSLFTPPHTPYLQQQQIETLSGLQKFMLELVKAGVYEPTDDHYEPIELSATEETKVWALHMRGAVQDYMRFKFSSDRAEAGYDNIAAVVTDWFGAREMLLAMDGQTNKKRCFIFPPLDKVRETLYDRKGLDIVAMPEETIKQLRIRG